MDTIEAIEKRFYTGNIHPAKSFSYDIDNAKQYHTSNIAANVVHYLIKEYPALQGRIHVAPAPVNYDLNWALYNEQTGLYVRRYIGNDEYRLTSNPENALHFKRATDVEIYREKVNLSVNFKAVNLRRLEESTTQSEHAVDAMRYMAYYVGGRNHSRSLKELEKMCLNKDVNALYEYSLHAGCSSPKTPEIKNVIYNNPATIVFWSDNTKTVVKCDDKDIYDPEKGLAMAISKKFLGNEYNYYNVFKQWIPEEDVIFSAYCHLNDHVYSFHNNRRFTHCALKSQNDKVVPIIADKNSGFPFATDHNNQIIGRAILRWSDKGLLAECIITHHRKEVAEALSTGKYTLDSYISKLKYNDAGNIIKGEVKGVIITSVKNLPDHESIKL